MNDNDLLNIELRNAGNCDIRTLIAEIKKLRKSTYKHVPLTYVEYTIKNAKKSAGGFGSIV